MKIEVILPLPKLQKNEKYECVSVEVTDLNISNQVQLTEMKAVDDNLWRADIFVPVSSLMDKVKYRFKVDICSYWLLGINRSYSTLESTLYKMQETDTIRQFFYTKSVYVSEFLSHLKDIVMRHSEKYHWLIVRYR